MGAEHSRVYLNASTSVTRSNASDGGRSKPQGSAWQQLQLGLEYSSTDIAVWPQCVPLVQWFTAQDAVVLQERLARRPRTRFLNVAEFRAWLSPREGPSDLHHPSIAASQPEKDVLRPSELPIRHDIMTPPSVLATLKAVSDQQPQHQTQDIAKTALPPPPSPQPGRSSLLVLDLFLEHVFATFSRSAASPGHVFAMEFLAAMVLCSRAIWDRQEKTRVLLSLFQDKATRGFHEADVAQLLLCALQGVAQLTVGVRARWQLHRVDPCVLARRLARQCMHYARLSTSASQEQQSPIPTSSVISASDVRSFCEATPAIRNFLALFSGEELRNPFTFGRARGLSDGLSLPSNYDRVLRHQSQTYEQLVQRYVSFEGRMARRQHSAATLLQATWRRRCSHRLAQCQREAAQHQRSASVVLLQDFVRQCRLARVLQRHAQVARLAGNGGVLVAGLGPCVPVAATLTASATASVIGPTPAPLELIQAFTLQGVSIAEIALSRTCAVGLQTDRCRLFAWGRCLPCIPANTNANTSINTNTNAVANSMTMTLPTPTRLAFQFPSHTPVRQVACGLRHALAVTADGQVHSWGFNDHGQLGHGDAATLHARSQARHALAQYEDPLTARSYEYLASPTALAYFAGSSAQRAEPIAVRRVCCGDYFSLALSVAGDVFSWGDGSEGQLGHGVGAGTEPGGRLRVGLVDRALLHSAFTYVAEPEPVLALSDWVVEEIACRRTHALAMGRTRGREETALWQWGNWGRRCGEDREHAFEPVAVEGVEELRLRRVAVGDHHALAEGGSAWLTLTERGGRVGGDGGEEEEGGRGRRAVYLLSAAGWSCSLGAIEKQWRGERTAILVDCDLDDLSANSEEGEGGDGVVKPRGGEMEEEEEVVADRRVLWHRRVATFALQSARQVAVYDPRVAHVRHCFGGDLPYEQMLTMWLRGRVEERMVVFPRGKPAGLYLQMLLPCADDGQRFLASSGHDEEQDEEEEEEEGEEPCMVEFLVVGSREAQYQVTRLGFATHVFHSVMRERLEELPARVRRVIPMDYMEANSLFVLEVEEEENEGDAMLEEMTSRVLAAQEAGALAVLLVLQTEAFPLELPVDSGIYIPVLTVSAYADPSRLSARALGQLQPQERVKHHTIRFDALLARFRSSQELQLEDSEERVLVPPAWAVRCFHRVDTTWRRVNSAIAHGATGVVLVQDAQSREMDGETLGAPVLLPPPLPSPSALTSTALDMRRSDRLVAMISASDGEALRAASYLAISATQRRMPFVNGDADSNVGGGSRAGDVDDATRMAACELLVDVALETREGGTTYAWGCGDNGRLGLGDPTREPFQDGYDALTDTVYRVVSQPTPVAALAGCELAQLVCGAAHSVAVTTRGRVWSWGRGGRGELAHTPSDPHKELQDEWVPRPVTSPALRYTKVVGAAANDSCSAFVCETLTADGFLMRRREVAQLRAVQKQKQKQK